ncbi:MAG: 1-phosphofructokinase [Anaerolineae bacterium]|nr:1-phosphofructokinase [Anaerolineae bacterium]
MIYTVTLNPALDRELTVPEISFDTVLRATTLRVDYGGKGFNVSRALHKLGAESVALGFVGGLTGVRIAAGLASLGIPTDFVEIGDETRTNISIVSATASQYVKVNEAGPSITPDERAALLQKITALAQPGDWWVLSGSLPRGLPVDCYAEIVDILRSAGARAVVDTSGEPLQYACAALPFLVKPNAHEATELTGIPISSPGDSGAAIAAIHKMGVENVFISFGEAGAVLSNGRQIWAATAPQIVERNPIGAGDSSVAGLMFGLSQNLPLPESLCWGVACGTTAASLSGTAVGDYALVASFFEQVLVRAL